jgi:hypothetical protein
MKVSILVPAYEPVAHLATTVSARQMFQVDELAQAIQCALSIEIPIFQGTLADAPASGYLLAFQVPSTIDPQLAHRIVAFDEDRSSLMRRVEQHGFVAAVEKQRYFEWRTRRDAERGYGLVGKKDVAAGMPARIVSGPYTSARYGMIASDTARDLPGLIAEYLKAHEAAFMAAGVAERGQREPDLAHSGARSSRSSVVFPGLGRQNDARTIHAQDEESRMPMTQEELLSQLSRLLPAQFEGLVYRLGIPASDLPAPSAPQGIRAAEVLRHLENTGELGRLEAMLAGRAPAGAGTARTAPAAPTRHNILFLAANPTGTTQVALDREARAIQVELERTTFRERFELVTRWAVEPLDLLREMRRLKPTVVHFSGHGGQQGLGFHSEGGAGLQVVSTDALQETFGAAGSSVKIVVLSACFSTSHAQALLAHVDCVVGTNGSLLDEVARNFAIGFYGACGDQQSVAVAFKQGSAAISLSGLRGVDRPELMTRPGVDASKLVLADPA